MMKIRFKEKFKKIVSKHNERSYDLVLFALILKQTHNFKIKFHT